MATLDDVARIALRLPETAEGERRGARTWSVARRVFAWERRFSQADLRRFGDLPVPAEPVLGVRTADLGEKAAMLAAHPGCLFTIAHFDGFSAVLVSLPVATVDVLVEVVTDGWLAMAPPRLAAPFAERS